MMNPKLQLAGASTRLMSRTTTRPDHNWLVGGVAAGVLMGAAISTYLWRQHVKAVAMLNLTPLERAEKLIEACEAKLDSIEKSVQGSQNK